MIDFLYSRWRGEVPLERVFGRDMLLIGTAINIACAAASFALASAGYPRFLTLLAGLAPVPWNLFLFLAVWRSAERDDGPAGVSAKVIAAFWLATMFVL